MRTKAFSDLGAACAGVLRNRKNGKSLLVSLEDLSFVMNATVDQVSAEVLDLVYLPLSLVLNSAMGEKGGLKSAEDADVPLAKKERVVLASLDCLVALIRMLREALRTNGATAAEVEKFTRSVLIWLSYFLQFHTNFPEEVNLKVSEIVHLCYERFMPLAVPLGEGEEERGSDSGGEEVIATNVMPQIGCHIAFALEQAGHASRMGAQGSKKLVKDLLASVHTIICYLGQDPGILAFFLPGIVSKLSVLLMQAVGKSQEHFASRAPHDHSLLKQCVTGPMANSACIQQAVLCLASVIGTSFRPYKPMEDFTKASHEAYLETLREMMSHTSNAGQEDGPKAPKCERGADTVEKTRGEFVVECDHDWYVSTFLKVEEILRHFLPDLCGHSSLVVRKCAVDSIAKIAKTCGQFETSRSFLESLFVLSHDENPSVSEKASNLVYGFGERYQSHERLKWEMLEEMDQLFLDYITKLVLAAKHTSSLKSLAKKVSSLLCLGRGKYMKHLYKEKVHYLAKFIEALRQCFSFDVMKTMERNGPLIWLRQPHKVDQRVLGHAAVMLPRMQPNFAFLHTPEDYEAAALICRTLGIISLLTQCTENVPVFDYIVRQYLTLFESIEKESHSWYIKSMSYCTMMSEMMVGCCEKEESEENQETLVLSSTKRLQVEYLSSAISLIMEEQSSEELWTTILTGSHSRCTQLACVFLESFGVFARVLKTQFTDKYEYLPSVLFILLDKFADDTNVKIQASADLSLRCICCHCDYESISDLLFSNSDYLIDTLVMRLMHLELYPQTTRLFKAVVRVVQDSDKKFLAFISLIREPFQMIAQNMSVYVRHLYAGHVGNYISILRMLAEVCRAGAEEMEPGANLKADETAEDVTSESTEVHKDVAVFISETCASIAVQCSELLHLEELHWELLDAIESSVASLTICKNLPMEEESNILSPRGAEENKVDALLPTIATIWPQLMAAFDGKMRKKCLKTVASVINCGGKFLMTRVTKEFWPSLSAFIDMAPDVQCAALDTLSDICRSPCGREALSNATMIKCAKRLTLLLKGNQTSQDLDRCLMRALASLKEVNFDVVFGFLLSHDTPPLSETKSPRTLDLMTTASFALFVNEGTVSV